MTRCGVIQCSKCAGFKNINYKYITQVIAHSRMEVHTKYNFFSAMGMLPYIKSQLQQRDADYRLHNKIIRHKLLVNVLYIRKVNI